MPPTREHPDTPHVVTTDTTFATVPSWLLNAQPSAKAVHLYAVLQRYANGAQEAWPSRATLAKRMGCSVDTVDRALAQLVTLGAVTITHRWKPDGSPTSSLYHVHVLPAGVAADLRPGGRTSAEGVAAPVRHRTITTELENPPTPAATAAGEPPTPGHTGQHRSCRACGTSPRQLADAARIAARPARPEWCGGCDEPTRTIDDDAQGAGHPVLRRCPTCHPLEIGRPR